MALFSRLCLLFLLPHFAQAEWQRTLQTAVQTHQAGDLVGAAKLYRQAIELNPDLRKHAAVLTNYGLTLQAEGLQEDAVDAFRQALELMPDNPDSFYNLANALSDTGEHQQAEEALKKCLALNPADADAYYDLASAMMRQADSTKVDAAVDNVRAAIALKPTDAKAHVALGDGLAAQRRWPESREAYIEACKLRPEHVASWASRGNVEEECGLIDEAESSWRKAISLFGDGGSSAGGDTGLIAGCYQNLGALLRRADRQPEARVAYTAALRLEPSSAEAYMGLGKAGAAPRNGFKEGNRAYLAYMRDTYGHVLRLQPNNAGAYTAIGEGMRMYGLQGGCDEFGGKGALDFYRDALKIVPSNTLALTHVAYGDRTPCSEADNEKLMCGAGDEESGADDLASLTTRETPTIDTLSAPAPNTAEGLTEALAKWRQNGLAIFPSLLDAKAVDALLAHVRSAQHGNHTADYTPVTRHSTHRSHKALPVGEARSALEAIAKQLQPFFTEALGAPAPALLESGFMVTAPGAAAQNFHRDVAPAVVSRSSMAVSVQVSLVETAANQGCLEVIPGSQVFTMAVTDKERQETMPKVRVAVPKGTVTVYALHTMHRGTANTHTADRPFYFFTLLGEGLAPPGLAYTMQPDDVGKWKMEGGTVASCA